MSNTGNSVSALIHKLKQSDFSILTTGTTTVSGSSADDTNYIFAGSASNPPALQFVGGLGTGSHTYSVGSLLAGNGAVDVQAVDTVNVTQGVQVFGGDLSLAETYGSVVALDGNSTIDHGGSLVGYETGAVFASSILINGTVDVGPSGTNTFDIGSGTGVGGAGVVRQTAKADTTTVSSAGKDVRFDVRAGDLVIGGRTVPDSFQATIGPAGGSNAPSLGPSAEVQVSGPTLFDGAVRSATFDTSTGVLSLLSSNSRDLGDLHFSGNASGLNINPLPVQGGSYISITDHPGTPSPIPINFT